MSRLLAELLASALLAFAVPAGVLAQASPPTAPDVCALMSVEELAGLSGIAFRSAESSPDGCTYETDTSTGIFASVYVNVSPGDLAGIRLFFGEGEDVEVAGRPAWSNVSGLWVDLGGSLLAVAPFLLEGDDPQAAAIRIAELLVPRLPGGLLDTATTAPDTSAVGPVCPLLSAEDVGGVLGVILDTTEGDGIGCTYSTSLDALSSIDDLVSVNVRLEPGDLQAMKETFTDGEDTTVAGQPAYWLPSFHALFATAPSGLAVVQFALSPEEVATLQKAADLLELLLPRL